MLYKWNVKFGYLPDRWVSLEEDQEGVRGVDKTPRGRKVKGKILGFTMYFNTDSYKFNQIAQIGCLFMGYK